MQSDIDDILQLAEQVSFKDGAGYEVGFDLVTARNFKESAAERIFFIGPRRWEREQDTSTGGRMYNGYWHYPVYIYVPSNARDHEDYSDFSQAGRAGKAFLHALLPSSAWQFEGQQLYEAQMSARELVCCEIEMTKFQTRRFL